MFDKKKEEKEKKLSTLLPKTLLSELGEIPYTHQENVILSLFILLL